MLNPIQLETTASNYYQAFYQIMSQCGFSVETITLKDVFPSTIKSVGYYDYAYNTTNHTALSIQAVRLTDTLYIGYFSQSTIQYCYSYAGTFSAHPESLHVFYKSNSELDYFDTFICVGNNYLNSAFYII